MFSKQDTSFKTQTGSKRKYGFLAIGAVAATGMCAALFGQAIPEQQEFNVEAGEHFVNFLSNHRDYMFETHVAVTELINEGNERISST